MELVIAVIGSGALSAVVSGAFSILAKKMDKNNAQTRLLNSITRDRIKHICRSKIIEGEITFDELEDLTAMYRAYHDNGGNGYCDELMEKVKQLPMRR